MVLSSKIEVDMDEPLYHYPKKEQGGFLTIDGCPDVGNLACLEEVCIFLYFIVCVILM